MPQRLSPSIFKIPTDKIRTGYYTDRYFLRTRDILIQEGQGIEVGYQFFPREEAVICGLDEAIAILKTCAGHYRDPARAQKLYRRLRFVQWKFQDASMRQLPRAIQKWQKERARVRTALNRLWESGFKKLKIYARHDGDFVKRDEPVLVIEGDPRLFIHLETVLLGVMARPTSTATAVRKVVKAAGRRRVLFFSARFDHYWIQATDGYAAFKAGAFAVSTDANADYWGAESMGTIPHFLIGCYQGDTAQACLAFDRHVPSRVNRIALVDWDNDCIGTTRKVLEALISRQAKVPKVSPELFRQMAPKVIGEGQGKLWAVRFDTSQHLRDKSVRTKGAFGVCPELVRHARKIFNQWGCQNLKIIVSGGFDEKKIRAFEKSRVPVDAYGVGSSLLRHRVDITADIVTRNSKPCAKVGRRRGSWKRLKRVG